MELALIILCICNITALAVVSLRLISLFSGERHTQQSAAAAPTSIPQTPYPTAPMSEEELREAKQKFDNEMAAFQEMMNYNADVAYGMGLREEE